MFRVTLTLQTCIWLGQLVFVVCGFFVTCCCVLIAIAKRFGLRRNGSLYKSSLCCTADWCDCSYIRYCVVLLTGVAVLISVVVWYGRLEWLFLYPLLCTLTANWCGCSYIHGVWLTDWCGCSYIRCCVL